VPRKVVKELLNRRRNVGKGGGSRRRGGVGGSGDDVKSAAIQEAVMSRVYKKVMSLKEIMTNDGSWNGGENERKMELAVAKLHRKVFEAPCGDGFVIGGLEGRTSGRKRWLVRNDTFWGSSVNKESLRGSAVMNECQMIAGGDNVDTPMAAVSMRRQGGMLLEQNVICVVVSRRLRLLRLMLLWLLWLLRLLQLHCGKIR
jgi:hypothetical protein